MSDEPNQSQPDDPNKKKKSPTLAITGLFLAFVPSIFFLALKDKPWGNYGYTFWVACGVSLICCFVASFLLCRHKTIWAIVLGILFFALNFVISILLGCGAILNS